MKFLSDISKKTWVYEDTAEINFNSAIIYLSFRDNGLLPVIFNNLKYGFSISTENDNVYEISLPPQGIVYESTDQDVFNAYEILDLVPNKDYIINLWSENNKEKWSETFTFSTPRPLSPYLSWTFNEDAGMWEPPIPYPDDDQLYSWNEQDQNWDIVIFE